MYRLKTNLYVFSGPMTFLQISFPSILTALFLLNYFYYYDYVLIRSVFVYSRVFVIDRHD